ncbi:hypothetical protein NL676_037275 [Syzygium grande]|nr:hypothetical protein NL676_037275 [Syzygium grande]
MSGKPVEDYERTLEKTSTWSVAVVCFVLLAISISIEHVIHLLGKGKVAFVTAYGIHQLHIFIFVLAIFHVLYCITTLALGTFKVCFFRQFFGSVTNVDYKALRHGFIMAHLAPENGTRFDFQEYIRRSLEEDFKVVVGISPTIWFAAVLLLLSNTHGWYSYLWLPFISLIIILMVGTKLEVIITKMGLRIKERGDVVLGTPLVQPGDELFWFGRPRFLLFLIHFVLFQNAFQLAFFAWSTWQFKMRNCFHQKLEDIIIRIAMGIIIQILCSYVTLPLYALVTQMGSTMKPTIFHDRVATALKHWHHGARKHVKHGQHSNTPTPSASAPATPEHGSSPIHLLHHYQQRSLDGAHTSPRISNAENQQGAVLGLQSPQNQEVDDVPWSRHLDTTGQEGLTEKPNLTSNQHEIDITLSDFSFREAILVVLIDS